MSERFIFILIKYICKNTDSLFNLDVVCTGPTFVFQLLPNVKGLLQKLITFPYEVSISEVSLKSDIAVFSFQPLKYEVKLWLPWILL